MPLPQNSREGRELSSLAKEIRDENAAAERDALSAVAHARRAGELLIEAKASVAHGEWGGWLAQNVDFSQQWAASLMRVAKAPAEEIESAVSVRGALRQLAPPQGDDPDSGRVKREVEQSLSHVESLLADPRSLSPAELWDIEEWMEEFRGNLRAAMSQDERDLLDLEAEVKDWDQEADKLRHETAKLKAEVVAQGTPPTMEQFLALESIIDRQDEGVLRGKALQIKRRRLEVSMGIDRRAAQDG